MAFYPSYGNKFLALKSTLFPDGELVHGFGTRIRFDEPTDPPAPERECLQELAPAAAGVAWLRQIHSTAAWRVTLAGGDPVYRAGDNDAAVAHEPPEGDALLTAAPGIGLVVRTADCFPLILFDPHRRVAAVVHSGWRGTLARITSRVMDQLIRRFGVRPADIHAAVGPGIQGCCYEVDHRLADMYTSEFPDTIQPPAGPRSGPRLDLAACLRRTLLDAGVPARQQDFCPLCTACNPLLFHSWRRDGRQAGRMITLAFLPGG
ncbi:MAG: polyphenol oxidase family protein [Acidobacteria bacterium]|nr:polyphenol oxidase family protein [Acidobacteriota bacterium]